MKKILNGLTLLEIMLAFTIFTIIMGAVIPALFTMQNASRTITHEVNMSELSNRIVMNAALRLSSSKILVAETDKVSYQKVIGIYPELQLGAVENISFVDLKNTYPEIDNEFKGEIPEYFKTKYEIDPTINLKGIFFFLKNDDMLIGISISGTNNEQFMTRTFYLETKLLGDAK